MKQPVSEIHLIGYWENNETVCIIERQSQLKFIDKKSGKEYRGTWNLVNGEFVAKYTNVSEEPNNKAKRKQIVVRWTNFNVTDSDMNFESLFDDGTTYYQIYIKNVSKSIELAHKRNSSDDLFTLIMGEYFPRFIILGLLLLPIFLIIFFLTESNNVEYYFMGITLVLTIIMPAKWVEVIMFKIFK
ncbi:hypothetical protein [uncultured Draconibacterium sp.]|uniref:hypothetical protein n=1 Tax=uncultured Draconibacterium sp. TaxID=1573823 RepID=UPI002AA6899F|nr:hypothetical protein [uncultured Draconibacterium sp.]